MKRGHDLSGVMKFATSPAWGEHLGEALGDHLGLAMEEFDFEADELADIVGDHWAGVLWGCAFEDLLTRTIQPDQIGRAHVCTPVTNSQPVCRLLLEKKK